MKLPFSFLFYSREEYSMKSLTKKIFQFAIPSITSMWIFTLYTIVDGIFIGKYVGPLALGAANLAMPIFNLSFGIGIMIAVGASTLISIAFSQKNFKQGNYYFNLASFFAFLLGTCLSLFCFFALKSIVTFLGANDNLFPYVYEYVRIILFFFPFYLCGYGWEIYIKVDGNAVYPMFCVLLGAGINIALDYIFLAIFHTGVQGAALATGLAQTITSLALLAYIIKYSKNFSFQKVHIYGKNILCILKTGFSEFFTEISSGILILIFNHFLFFYLGERGIISFSAISYLSSLVIMTMIGFAQGIQPILSFSYGKKSKKEILHIFNISILSIIVLGIFFLLFACFFSQNLVKYFLSIETETLVTSVALKKYSISYLFMGLNILFSAFFTALKKAKFSLLITFCRGIFLPIIALFSTPFLLGKENLWFAATISEGMTFLISFYLYQNYKKELLHD